MRKNAVNCRHVKLEIIGNLSEYIKQWIYLKLKKVNLEETVLEVSSRH